MYTYILIYIFIRAVWGADFLFSVLLFPFAMLLFRDPLSISAFLCVEYLATGILSTRSLITATSCRSFRSHSSHSRHSIVCRFYCVWMMSSPRTNQSQPNILINWVPIGHGLATNISYCIFHWSLAAAIPRSIFGLRCVCMRVCQPMNFQATATNARMMNEQSSHTQHADNQEACTNVSEGNGIGKRPNFMEPR